MNVNVNWNYEECLYFICLVKNKYKGIRHSFSSFGGNKKGLEETRQIKKDIYGLKFADYEEWKKDKLWEYLNDDIDYTELWKFI